jgi:heme-degrading monooxygenase HmoA
MIHSYLHLRAKPARRDELLSALERLELKAAIHRSPGLLAVEIQIPFDDDDRLLVSSAWSSREHYERWLDSSACRELLHGIEDVLADAPEFRTYHLVDAIGNGVPRRAQIVGARRR